MDACPRCGRAFSAGEVTGLGILRPRDVRSGGPYVEFTCPGCRAVHRLIPHGQARYAKPGEPPPPAPPPSERRLPWERETRTPANGERRREPAPAAAAAEPRPAAKAPPEVPPPEPPPPRPRASAAPPASPARPAPTPWDVLGVSAAAGRAEVEAAFRAKALQCHPDKVAHLDPEFRALAERKFKDLLAAFEALVGERRATPS
jgi:hypothetical protein